MLLDGKAVVAIANDKLTLSVRTEGGSMVRMVLNDDPDAVNPMHTGLGHFVCVDGFGPVSPEERDAGLRGHGEAHRVPWDIVSSREEQRHDDRLVFRDAADRAGSLPPDHSHGGR